MQELHKMSNTYEVLGKISHNVLRLCAGGELELQKFSSAQKPNRITAVDVSTLAPLAQNRCCAYVAVNLG